MTSNGDKAGAPNSDTHQEEPQGIQMEQAADSFGCSSSPDRKDLTSISKQCLKEDELESIRVEMGVVREENERLKSLLSQIVNNYQSLQKHFHGALRQEEARQKKSAVPSHPVLDRSQEDEQEPDELVVSLTLGRTNLSGLTKTDEDDVMPRDEHKCRLKPRYSERSSDEPSKNQMSRESFEELKEDKIAEIWPPSKILKTMKSADDEPSQPSSQVKKARVSVRARCDTPTMNDGCHWRKYGQKISKGNPCPRAYYRCTISPSCPVRKQVQRCSEDMSILITTYEGNHNHQLPVPATAMASTTSAAASMLQSRSSTSQQDREASTATATNNSISTTSAGLHGLNFSSSLGLKSNQLYFPNSSISTSNSHPTITLDLTTPINASNYNRFSSYLFTSDVPKYSSTTPSCFDFSSSSPWESSSFSNYGANPTSRSIQFQNSASSLWMQETREHYYKPYSQESLMSADTIAAATKAIATNPSFHSALAAALRSRVGNGTSGENFALKYLKLGGSSSADSRQTSSNRKPMSVVDLQPQAGLMNLFPPSLSLTTSKDGPPGPPTDSYKDRIESLASSN